MEVSLKTRETYAELDEFIELLDDSDKNKIPNSVRDFFKNEKDKNYKKHIDRNTPIDKQNLKEETLALIALLYLRYICDNEEEKSRLEKIYAENEKKYREELKEKYDSEKALERKNEQKDNVNEVDGHKETIDNAQSESNALMEHKESIFRKIINKLKKFFKKY